MILKVVIRAVDPVAAGLLGRSAEYKIGRALDRYACWGRRINFQKEMALALVTGKGMHVVGLNTRRKLAPVNATAAGIKTRKAVAPACTGGFAMKMRSL